MMLLSQSFQSFVLPAREFAVPHAGIHAFLFRFSHWPILVWVSGFSRVFRSNSRACTYGVLVACNCRHLVWLCTNSFFVISVFQQSLHNTIKIISSHKINKEKVNRLSWSLENLVNFNKPEWRLMTDNGQDWDQDEIKISSSRALITFCYKISLFILLGNLKVSDHFKANFVFFPFLHVFLCCL